MKKRVVSLLLCLIMALSLIPTVAFAAEPVAEEQQSMEQLDTLAGDPQATSLITSTLGWKYAKIEQPSAGGLKITQPSGANEDLSDKVTVTIEKFSGGTENMNQNTLYPTTLYKKVHITSADPNYYIAYVAFCCNGPEENSYKCTAPLLLRKGNKSTASVSMPMWELSWKQSLVHASYCWLMVMVKPIEETPTPDLTTGTLTVTKNIEGLSFAQVPVKNFEYIANSAASQYTVGTELFTLTVAETATGITAKNFKELDVGLYSLTESSYNADVAGYKCVTTFAIDGEIKDRWDHSDPNDGPEWHDFNIAAGGTTNIVITDTYTPIGNDVNNYAIISIKKCETGNENKLLAGAKFKLEKLDGTNWVAYGSVGTTDANGALAYTVMAAGDYKLTEVEAPTGYKLGSKSEWTFTVVKDSKTELDPNTNKYVTTNTYKFTKVGDTVMDPDKVVWNATFEIPNDKITTVTANIPIIKNVTKGLNSSNPGTATFTFKAEAYYNDQWVSLNCTGNKITTTGVGSKDGTIAVVIPTEYFKNNNTVKVRITEVNDKQDNWTYSTNSYEVYVKLNGDGTTSLEFTPNSSKVFTNTYNYTYTPPTRPTNPTRRQPTTTTTNKPVQSVKTGDMGIALYAVTSLLSLSGTALLIKKRKDEK